MPTILESITGRVSRLHPVIKMAAQARLECTDPALPDDGTEESLSDITEGEQAVFRVICAFGSKAEAASILAEKIYDTPRDRGMRIEREKDSKLKTRMIFPQEVRRNLVRASIRYNDRSLTCDGMTKGGVTFKTKRERNAVMGVPAQIESDMAE